MPSENLCLTTFKKLKEALVPTVTKEHIAMEGDNHKLVTDTTSGLERTTISK